MPVSVRTRLAARRACGTRAFSSGPVVPAARACSNACFTCPAICPSPTTSECSDAATRSRCRTAASSSWRYSTGSTSAAVSPRPAARNAAASKAGPTVTSSTRLQVDSSTASSAWRAVSSARARAAAAGSKASFSRTPTAAVRKSRPTTRRFTTNPHPQG